MLVPAPQTFFPERRALTFQLSNGMTVLVIPDHRAPVVTHMVWYRVGAADDPPGASGLAHFLEHLMFKSTDQIPDGKFSQVVMQLGGQLNAFTGQDYTAYFQRIASDKLRLMMEMEADRMINLRLTEEEVRTERQVIIEERASRYDNSPEARLFEQMNAALYLAHPYRLPVIGWAHEIATLSREAALEFYRRHYNPNTAFLVVAGDVNPDDVWRLADQTYGRIDAEQRPANRHRPQDPPHEVARRLTLKDNRVSSATIHRAYLTPSYATAKPGEAEALELLAAIIGNGTTGRLCRSLVIDESLAASAGATYSGGGLDSGTLSIHAVALPGCDLSTIEVAIDKVLDAVRTGGVTEVELERAKRSLRGRYTFACDEQESLANVYGRGLAVGQTLEQIESWPTELSKVTAEQVTAAATAHLDARRSVTGWLLPQDNAGVTASRMPA